MSVGWRPSEMSPLPTVGTRVHRTDQRAWASHGLLLGCGDYAVTLFVGLGARRAPESGPAGGSRGLE